MQHILLKAIKECPQKSGEPLKALQGTQELPGTLAGNHWSNTNRQLVINGIFTFISNYFSMLEVEMKNLKN